MSMEKFEKHTVSWELGEALVHLKELIKEVDNSEYDEEGSDMSYFIGIQHVIEHLNLSWHFRNQKPENMGTRDQEEFEEFSNTIPNLMGEFKLGKTNRLTS
jgi:hypothetical protein